jgi:hypothetical protein
MAKLADAPGLGPGAGKLAYQFESDYPHQTKQGLAMEIGNCKMHHSRVQVHHRLCLGRISGT